MLGLSITSSWGNGHATTFRGLLRALAQRGHRVLFLERDVPWYAAHRDLPRPPFGRTELYGDLRELERRFAHEVRAADAVIVGSYVPDGVAVGAWVVATARGLTAFYDIDTPVTLAKLERGEHDYVSPELIERFDLYLSFAGGPTLDLLERRYRSPAARALYCSVDPEVYAPAEGEVDLDLGYLGTYSADRQERLDALLLEPARRAPQRRFAVAGPQYPDDVAWPPNVARWQHLPPDRHRGFYTRQRFTLNITRADMVRAGYAPSVRLFEAAACGVPVISDDWPGLETFFRPGEEILVATRAEDTLRYLEEMPEDHRRRVAAAGRARVLREHTARQRAAELESYLRQPRGAGFEQPA